MKVKELINTLNNMDPEQEVMVSYSSGDYWNSQVAEPVEDIDVENVQYSEYHRKYKVCDEDKLDDDEQEFKNVVILR